MTCFYISCLGVFSHLNLFTLVWNTDLESRRIFLFSLLSFCTHKKKPFMRASLMLIRPDEFVAWKRKHKDLIVVFGSCGDESVGFTIRKKTLGWCFLLLLPIHCIVVTVCVLLAIKLKAVRGGLKLSTCSSIHASITHPSIHLSVHLRLSIVKGANSALSWCELTKWWLHLRRYSLNLHEWFNLEWKTSPGSMGMGVVSWCVLKSFRLTQR